MGDPCDWRGAALRRVERGQPSALVTLLAVEGSTPREAGAKMLVWPGGQVGTIGGGALEYTAADQGRRLLDHDAAFKIQDYPLGPLLGQCCGGRVRLMIERLGARDADWIARSTGLSAAGESHLIVSRIMEGTLTKSIEPPSSCGAPSVGLVREGEPLPLTARGLAPGWGDRVVERIDPRKREVCLIGAGHVGVAVARALAPLPFKLVWFDVRPDVAAAAGARTATPGTLADIVGHASADGLMLIMTHDHALDYALCRAALRGRAGYVGLIGSDTKRVRFMRRLAADGLSGKALSRLICPIGLPGLVDKAPEVIAASVAADLLLRRRAASIQAASASA